MRFGWCQANTANIAPNPDASHGRDFACPRLAFCFSENENKEVKLSDGGYAGVRLEELEKP